MLPRLFGPKLLNADDYNAISGEIESLRRQAVVGASSDFEIKSLSSGRLISLTRKQEGTTAAGRDEGGVVLEMYPAWDGNIQYLQGERVVYKPEGATYFYVYHCVDTTAGSGDAPDSSGKWSCNTALADAWTATAYAQGATVMHGTPWQLKSYTASAATTADDVPGKSDKWTYAGDVLLGIPSWPAGGTHKVPFASYEAVNVRYSDITHQLAYYHRRKIYNRDGSLRSVAASNYVTYSTAVPHPTT